MYIIISIILINPIHLKSTSHIMTTGQQYLLVALISAYVETLQSGWPDHRVYRIHAQTLHTDTFIVALSLLIFLGCIRV